MDGDSSNELLASVREATTLINKTSVKFLHYRDIEYIPTEHGSEEVVSPNGGATVAYAQTEGHIEFATAFCHPHDNYSKSLGRVKSEGRMYSVNYLQVSHTDSAQAFLQEMDDEMLLNYGYRRR